MGNLRKIKNSPYWQAVFMSDNSVEIQRSTKTTDKARAEEILGAWALATALKRQKGLCALRVRKVMNELSKLAAGDCTKTMSVIEYSKRFLTMSRTSLERMTYVNRCRAVDLFKEYLGERVAMPLEDVTKPIISSFRDHLLELKHLPSTVKQRIEVLHNMFNKSIDDGVTKHNPCDGVIVNIPKVKGQQESKKRKALNYEEGLKLVAHANVEEMVAVVMGLDLGSRLGDTFGLDVNRIDIHSGRITYWVEKADKWHTVNLFPNTCLFLQEYMQYHRPNNETSLLINSLGVTAGPDVDAKKRLSKLKPAFKSFRHLVDRAGLGEWVKRKSGSKFNTVAFHCGRITNENAMKYEGISTELIMWRLCQKSKKANEAYDRFNPENVKTAIFGKLGFEVESKSEQSIKKSNENSMTFSEMMKVVDAAREKLVSFRLGTSHKTS